MKKNNFLLSNDHREIFAELTDEQAGRLIKAIFQHEAGEHVELAADIRLLFIPIRQWLERNRVSYEKTCAAHAAAGVKGGRPKNQTKLKETKRLLDKAKKPDYDPEYDLKSDSDDEGTNVPNGAQAPEDKSLLEIAIENFIEHRKKLRKPMTNHAVELIRIKLNKLATSPAEQIAIIEQSIEQGWSSVFSLNTQGRALQQKQLGNPFFNAADKYSREV